MLLHKRIADGEETVLVDFSFGMGHEELGLVATARVWGEDESSPTNMW